MKGIPYEQRVGTKINNLTILEITGKRNTGKRTKIMCKVRCDCGKEFETLIESVISGQTASCGCQRKKFINSAERKEYNNYRNSAKNRGFDFELTYEDFKEIIYEKCVYCGSDPAAIKEVYGDTVICNGIDRVDSSKGYKKGNVVPCCKTCNQAKNCMDLSDFLNWIRRLVAWQTKP